MYRVIMVPHYTDGATGGEVVREFASLTVLHEWLRRQAENHDHTKLVITLLLPHELEGEPVQPELGGEG